MADKPRSRETRHIPLSRIVCTPGLRALKDEEVRKIADSMAAVGLITPITVNLGYKAENPDEEVEPGQTKYHIIAGRHRFMAAQQLGWSTIECFVDFDADEIDAELWEIAENLHRADLTTLERKDQEGRYIELCRARDNFVRAADEKGGVGRPEGGLRKASRDLGLAKSTAWEAERIHALTDEAKQAAKDCGLDENKSALLKAASVEPSKQASVVRDIAQARALRVEQDIQNRAAKEVADVLAEHVPGELWDGLKANLHAAGKINLILAAFNNLIGNSIMDRRYGE